MDESTAIAFYAREDIQERLIFFARDREIGLLYDGFFGKRPSVLENFTDLSLAIKRGVRSFHFSEERWLNPLLLNEVKKNSLEELKNRIGWDLILDLDGVAYEYAQIVGSIIIEYLDQEGIYNVSTKFSGNKGFHIAIPFEAFSSSIIGLGRTAELFPQAAQKIAAFLSEELKGKISKTILEKEGSIDNISKKFDIPLEELVSKDEKSFNFNYMRVIEIDTILITSRHLCRMPYSLNEKSGLVSIPVDNKRILEFEKQEAKPENVGVKKYSNFEFLKYDSKYGKDGDKLLLKAYENADSDFLEAVQKNHFKNMHEAKRVELAKKGLTSKTVVLSEAGGDVFEINQEVLESDFPPTIKYLLKTQINDGRKRALFVLLTFLTSCKWEFDLIENLIKDWNEKQDEPLRQNYLAAQLNWFKNHLDSPISPPNYKNENYYKQIGVSQELIQEDNSRFRQYVKNPLHYVFLLLQEKESKKNSKVKNKKPHSS